MHQFLGLCRSEGYLIISGGLVVHTFENNLEAFDIKTAKPIFKEFQKSIAQAVMLQDVSLFLLIPLVTHRDSKLNYLWPQPAARRIALESLTNHPGFRAAHPREEHFIPLYIAAGAGESGESRVVADIYGQATYAFGL